MRRVTLFVVALAVCVAPLALSAAEAQLFGKKLAGLSPTPLAEVLANPKDGASVCLEGAVSAVCRNKGCWLELKQADKSIHVTFEGYSFFVPKDAAGKTARLEGRVKVEAPDAAEVEHLRKEGASAAAGAKVSVVATGVELR